MRTYIRGFFSGKIFRGLYFFIRIFLIFLIKFVLLFFSDYEKDKAYLGFLDSVTSAILSRGIYTEKGLRAVLRYIKITQGQVLHDPNWYKDLLVPAISYITVITRKL